MVWCQQPRKGTKRRNLQSHSYLLVGVGCWMVPTTSTRVREGEAVRWGKLNGAANGRGLRLNGVGLTASVPRW